MLDRSQIIFYDIDITFFLKEFDMPKTSEMLFGCMISGNYVYQVSLNLINTAIVGLININFVLF